MNNQKSKLLILKQFFFLVFLAYGHIAISQNYSISGLVKDETSNPVAFSNVLLLKIQDSTFVSGTTSDENGVYKLEGIAKGNYILKASYVGYITGFINVMLESENIQATDILLKEDIEALDAVEIIAKKPTVKIQADRLTFNVENTALSEGNILQVLKSTPRVLVLEDAITIKNSAATVYINDKKVNLTGAELTQLLEGAPAETVQTIEVITNPSAKYDADSGTVLNIVMSRNLITGYRGSVSANYTQGVFPRSNYSTSHFFKNSKINVFASYNYTNDKLNRDDNIGINFLDDNNILQRREENFNRNTDKESHNFNFNFDYFINERNTLSVSANGQLLPFFDYRTLGNSIITDGNENVLFSFDSENQSRDERYNLSFDLDYVHEFKDDSKLSLNINYTDYDYERDQNVNSEYFSAVGVLDSITVFNTLSEQDTEFLVYKADYTLPLGDDGIFEAGGKVSNIESGSFIIQNDIENGIETLDVDNTDVFTYDEDIYAIYANFQKQWGKWNINAGLRFEDTNIIGVSELLGNVNTQEYSEFFPTTSIIFQATEKFNIYSNYKRSITRPNYQSLNPFQFFLTDNTVVTGNPALQPVFNDRISIGTSFLNHFTFEAYYSRSVDNIIEIPIQDNENSILSFAPTNLGSTRELSFDFEVFYNITKNWSLYFGTSVYNVEDESIFDGQRITQDLWSNYSTLNNDFSFLKDNSLNINFAITYISSTLQGFRVVEDLLLSDLSISKSILKGKGTLSIAISDLFNEQDFRVTTQFLDQDNSSFTDIDNRTIKFGFRYRFGNTKLETNERTKSSEESSRLERRN